MLILREISERGRQCIDQIADYRKCAWKNKQHFGNWNL